MAIIINSSFAGEKRKAKSEVSGEYLELGMRELKALPIIGMSCKKRPSWG